jgi:HAD superfamily hydrolase (TIGR01549 family)
VIRLVTLDLYDTLAGSVPTRPDKMAQACREVGLFADVERLRLGYVVADDYYTVENGSDPLHLRLSSDVEAFYLEFTRIVLAEAGLPSDVGTIRSVRARMLAMPNRRELYPDVEPALAELRDRGLSLAIVSNTPVDATTLCDQLGLCERVDFIVSSCLVGCEKPDPRIFQAALERAGVPHHEALHVGDQPLSDVVGALGVGMRALLIDRDGLRATANHCPRISSMSEVVHYLKA